MVDLKTLFKIDPEAVEFDCGKTSETQIEAAEILVRSHADRAGEEALFRCLTYEKNDETKKAFFWLGVYVEIKSRNYKA